MMTDQTYRINTGMGMVSGGNSRLPFLSEEEFKNFNEIGYTGRLNGNKITRVDYLNSLQKGYFIINQTKFDNGDFSESFDIIRVMN